MYSLHIPLLSKSVVLDSPAPVISLLQCLSDSLAPPAVIVIVAIVAVMLSHTSVATTSTIVVGLKVLKPQSSWLPVNIGSWASAASPPAIS